MQEQPEDLLGPSRNQSIDKPGPQENINMLIFWEMRDSSMSFTTILPKTSQHTIHKVYC